MTIKGSLFIDLMRFALAKKTTQEQLRYIVLGLIFFTFLARVMSTGAKSGDSVSSSQAGDDIYPLF